MELHPYRERADVAAPLQNRDREIVAVACVVWVAGVARVAGALAHGGPMGADATLALVAVVLLPLLAFAR